MEKEIVLMRKVVAAAMIVSVGVAMSACSHQRMSQSCPDDATHAVLWSSESSDAKLQMFRNTELLWEEDIAVKGLQPSRGMERDGDTLIAVATGNQRRDESHIVLFDPQLCKVSTVPIDARGIFGWAAGEGSVVTMDTVDDVAHVARFSLDGATVAEARFAKEGTSGVGVSEHDVVLFTDIASDWHSGDGSPRRFIARRLDPETLHERWKHEVPVPPFGWQNPVIVGEYAIFTSAFDEQRNEETRELYRLNLHTGALEQSELSAASPYWLTPVPNGDDSTMYIAHTAMNPSVRPLSDYRHVSVVRLPSMKVETLQLDRGLAQLSVRGDLMVAFGDHDVDGLHVDAYATGSELKPLFQHNLTVPGNMRDAYVSAVVALR